MRQAIAVLILATALGVSHPIAAAQSGCPQHHLDGAIPTVLNAALLDAAKELCYLEFSIVHSGLTKTPLWAGERLTSDRLSNARNIEREDVFAAEPALPPNERSELGDYSGSGFDRGHVAPAADMSSDRSKAESFTLANIVPQTASSNRGPWSELERTVRELAMARGDVFVVSGPLFLADDLQVIGNGVVVPTHMYKAVHVPGTGETGAFVVENDESPEVSEISIEALAAHAGIDVFPTVPAELKATFSLGYLKETAAAIPAQKPVMGVRPAPFEDLDCSDFSGPVRVEPGDPHRLDRDGDGIGCE